jgi:hypothetical protein
VSGFSHPLTAISAYKDQRSRAARPPKPFASGESRETAQARLRGPPGDAGERGAAGVHSGGVGDRSGFSGRQPRAGAPLRPAKTPRTTRAEHVRTPENANAPVLPADCESLVDGART